MSPVERDQGPQPVMFPAPIAAPHPTVAAPKCVDCQHHQQGPAGHNSRAHLCGHPVVPRSLVTGTPAQLCCDMRNDGPAGYTPAPGAVSQLCGAEGRLFAALPSKEFAFLTGEAQPLQLEGDDRRYSVEVDPEKVDASLARGLVDPEKVDVLLARFLVEAAEHQLAQARLHKLVTPDREPAVLPVHPSRQQPSGPDCADCTHSYLDDIGRRHCDHHSLPVQQPLTRSVMYASRLRQPGPRGSRERCGPSAAWFSQRQDKVPLCADCQHSGQDLVAYPDGKMVCSHPSVERAPVSGIAMRCDHARGRSVHCGEVGRLFEPRVSEAVGGLGD